MRARPFIGNPRRATALGIAAYALAGFLLWDAYEHRGKSRPFVARIWGGLV